MEIYLWSGINREVENERERDVTEMKSKERQRRSEIGGEADRGTMRKADKELKTNNDGKSQENRLGIL